MSRRLVPSRWLALALGAFFFIVACRASDFVAQYSARPVVSAVKALAKTHTPTATLTLTPTETQAQTDTQTPTATEAPTETDTPTETETPTEVQRVAVKAQAPPPTETDEPTETPVPTREFEYMVSYSWCGPNRAGTFIVGTVYQDGLTVNGLLVRLSIGPGGDPIVNDYKTGTDSTKPGGYTQIIGAGGPRGGLYYLWLIDPQTKQRISDMATVKTDPKYVEDTDQSNGSCQSAEVDFTNDLASAPVPAQLETPIPTETSTPSPTGTQYTSTPTRTGTPTLTATPHS